MKVMSIVRKLGSKLKIASTVAVLAGGMTFTGTASAVTVVSEDFEAESPGTSGWTFSQYGTAANYSNSPHSGVPGGGESYGWAPGGTSTPPNLTSTAPVDLGAGDGAINFDGWLAAYTSNDDYARFEAEFFDDLAGGGSSLGNVVLADGSLFTAADGVTEYVDAAGVLTAGDAGADSFNWKHYVTSKGIPAGAMSVVIHYFGDAANNNGNDAYADNIHIVTAVPEPTTILLLGVSGCLMICARRTR